jgi:hypothetical protein
MPTSSSAQDTPQPEDSKRATVLVRLPRPLYRDMRRAMADLDIDTNQGFAEAAIAEKVARGTHRRGDEDRRQGDRRAA